MRSFRPHSRALFVIFGLLCCISAGCATPPAPSASPVQPAVEFDLQRFIDERIAAGETRIVVPPGRHLVTPRNHEHLVLTGLRNIVIDATGAEMLCSEASRAITIHDCENLTLRGLVIDYDPLPYIQARITSVSPDKLRMNFEVIGGYADLPQNAYRSPVEIFNPETGRLRPGRTIYNTLVTPTGARSGTIERNANQAAEAPERIGDIAVLDSGRLHTPHGIYATDSRGLVFENITFYSAPMFSFLEIGCDGSRYVGCSVKRRPPELDYAVRDHFRLRSGNADAFHSKSARVGPTYERCSAHFMGDDAIAINGDFHLVTGGEGATLRVLEKFSMNMRVGDRVHLVTADAARLEDRRIVAIEPLGTPNAEDAKIVDAQYFAGGLRERGLKQVHRVTLDAPVELPPGGYIASAEAIGNGFVIDSCDVGHNRSRGLLIKAGSGRISNNRIEGSVMTAIFLTPEPWWLEAGFSDNVTIENNTVIDCAGTGIAVSFRKRNQEVAPSGAFRNITVRNNRVEGGTAPAMVFTSIRGLVDEGNVLLPKAPATRNEFGFPLKRKPDEPVQDRLRVNIE